MGIDTLREIKNYKSKIDNTEQKINELKKQLTKNKNLSKPKLRVSTAKQGDEYTCNICDHGWKTKNHLGLSHKCPSCSSSNIQNKDLIERNNDHKGTYYVALEKSKSAKKSIIPITKKIEKLEKDKIQLNKKLKKLKEIPIPKITNTDYLIIAIGLIFFTIFKGLIAEPIDFYELLFNYYARIVYTSWLMGIAYAVLYKYGEEDPNNRSKLMLGFATGSFFWGMILLVIVAVIYEIMVYGIAFD